MGKSRKGLSLDECVELAERFIAKNGACLLLLDMVDSETRYSDGFECRRRLLEVLGDMEGKFSDYLPENSLSIGEKERGFRIFRGDSASAGISSAEAVRDIIKYHTFGYPDVPLYWSVAEDGWDDDGYQYIGC